MYVVVFFNILTEKPSRKGVIPLMPIPYTVYDGVVMYTTQSCKIPSPSRNLLFLVFYHACNVREMSTSE